MKQQAKTMRAAMVGMNGALLLIGLAMVGLAFGASLRTDLALMSQHPLFSTGMNCLQMGLISTILLLCTGEKKQAVKIDSKK